jgi:uncharacterized protein involved in exopolysaccharide biosynthesis
MTDTENSKAQEPQGPNLLLAVKRNWLIALIVTLGVSSVPAYKALTKRPTFQSNAIILVANQTAVPVAEDATIYLLKLKFLKVLLCCQGF